MRQIPVEEAKAHLSDLIAAAMDGETVLITENGQVIQLIPVRSNKGRRQFGSAKGLIKMADDFDAPWKISKSIWNEGIARYP